MRNKFAAAIALLVSTGGLAAVGATLAAPNAYAEGSCVFEDHRVQEWHFTWVTTQEGMKVTCPASGKTDYQIAITCSNGFSEYGNWAHPGETSYALCQDHTNLGESFTVDSVTNYYVKTW